jgi:carboxymethylenebutenolidase
MTTQTTRVAGEEVEIKCKDGAVMKVFRARPGDDQPHPAIIVIHEAWGLNDQIRSVAERYAEEGFVAMAPHLFVRSGDLLTEKNIESAMKLMWSVPPEKRNDPTTIQAVMAKATDVQRTVFQLFFQGRETMEKTMAEDLLSCVRFLREDPRVHGDRLGATGFCMGGGLTYQLATLHPLRAAVPFYGANPKPLEAVAKIQGAVLGIYAGNDGRINAEVPALVEQMLKHQKDFTLKIYPRTEHAFFNDTRPVYDRYAAADSWQRAVAFFRQHLE